MKNKDVEAIVKEYLQKNGFDGIMESFGECACLIDDLAPCGEMQASCIAGYKHNCNSKCEHETIGDGWHISTEKPFKV